MALISCFDCGARISDEVGGCPRCRAYSVKGVDCVICGGRMKTSQSPMRGSVYRQRAQLHWFCGFRVFGHTGYCRECGHAIWGSWLGWLFFWTDYLDTAIAAIASPHLGYNKCYRCGVSNPLNYRGTCGSCQLPAYRQLHELTTDGQHHSVCRRLRG